MAILEKEKILLVAAENIPSELKQLKQWVLWKAVWDEKQKVFTKVPYRSNGRYKAYSNKPESWDTFDNIYEAYENGIGEGIGFVLSETNPYLCIDIDNIESMDSLPELAQEITSLSYAELSPSGEGIHVWIKNFNLDSDKFKNKNTELEYEIYSDKRFITFTGETLNDLAISEGKEIESFIEKVFKREETVSTLPQQSNGRGQAALSESELIQIAEKSKTGSRFKLFMNGGWEQIYESQSEADLSFLNDLAFWTNCDYHMMDSIFRKSSLMRDKWDRKQNKTTYGDEQLNKAIQECTNTFVPDQKVEDGFIIPKGYFSEHGCLYKIIEKKKPNGEIDVLEVMICRQTPTITRSFMNVEHPQLYHELTWFDKGKGYKEVIPAGDLAIKKELLKLSYKSLAVTDNNAKELITYFDRLNMIRQSDHEFLVERIGHIKNTFIHPLTANGVTILPPDIGEKQLLEAFQSSGTVEEWIEHVFKPIQKHPKALLMVVASFTSVLLQNLKMKPFIIDFSGVTSQGKTTVLRICASVWGTEHLVSEWNLTKVAAERKASFLNSFPIILDDTRKADEKQLQSFIYNFSGGRSKGRGSISGSQREFTWGNLMLSTGEDSLNVYAERAGGVAARILPITGIPFEGENYQFFNDLYKAIEKYYGSIGLEFLNYWHEKKNIVLPHFDEYNNVFQKKSQGNEVISRIARYYAAIVFTGRLLNEFFNLEIDLLQLYHLFDELNAENKSIDKPLQLLEMILQDLDSQRECISGRYEARSNVKAIYKNGTLFVFPTYLKEFLKAEEKTIRSEWLRRGMTIASVKNGKVTDSKNEWHHGKNNRVVPISPEIVEKLGFDFQERETRSYTS